MDALSRTIHVSRLPPGISKEDLENALSISGTIESTRIEGTDAYVVFENDEFAENSLMLDNTFIGGVSVSIEKMTEPVKKEKPQVEEIHVAPEKSKEEEQPLIVKKEVETQVISKGTSECQKELMNAMDLVNLPARKLLPGDDLFSAVFNRRYGIVVVGLWSCYLVFSSAFSG